MHPPLIHPAAWRGEQLWQMDDVLLELSPRDVAEIDTALHHSPTERLDAITAQHFLLPRFGARLADVQRSLEEGAGFAWLRGLAIDKYSEADCARLFWGLMTHIGTAVPQTADGDVIFPVCDAGLPGDHPQSRGPSSSKQLTFHTDRCDVIAFLCVRQAVSGGENDVVSSVAIYNRMHEERPDLLATLLEPYYYQRHNVDPGNSQLFYQQPVFSFHEGQFAANLLRVLIDRAYQSAETPALTALQREALDYVEQIARDPEMHVRFRLQPGDIILMNNFVTLHRRSEFQDAEAADQKRLLLRLWLSVPNSRPLDPRFAASYGSTTAGAIRGGMRLRSSATR